MTSVIGKNAVVRGKVRGDADLEVQGLVEGDIAVSGDLLVDAGGLVGAAVAGRRVTVRGSVRGDIQASEMIEIGAQARVVGDLSAPRIIIIEGAMVRGLVSTVGQQSGQRLGASASRTHQRPAAPARAAETRAPEVRASSMPSARTELRSEAKAAAPVAQVAKAAARAPVPSAQASVPKLTAQAAASRRAAPAPTVPVLKKGTKAQQKRR
jgi:cytoskeletal protein CcmA (bactofilin family)